MDVDQPVNDVGSGTSSIHWPSNTPSRSLRVSGLKRQPLSGLIPWNTTDLMHFTRNVWKCQKLFLSNKKSENMATTQWLPHGSTGWIWKSRPRTSRHLLRPCREKLPTVGAVVPLGMSVLLDLQSTPKQTSKFGKFGISLLWLLWPVWTWIFRSDLWFSDRKMTQIWLSWLFQRSVTGSRSRSQCVQPFGTLVFGTTKLNHSSKLASFKSYANKQLVLFLLVLFTMDLYDAIWQESLRNTSKISPHIVPSYNHIPIIYPLYIHYIPIIYIYIYTHCIANI